ncbi:MAG: hypothetical protein F4X74_13210 [Acidimicrobiia bacterium]|nr:hypothetical protein [Acidimicrobiia bacterium]
MSLQGVERFRVQAGAISDTEEAIRSAGQDGFELFVVWSGRRHGDTFAVTEVHVPQQTSYKLDGGRCVKVDGPELHRLNMWLYKAQQVIGAQVHSHPLHAYHSETDDSYPIATLDGSLSIVLPFFGRDGFGSRHVAAYRLSRGGWLELGGPLSDLLEVVADGAC